MTKVTGTTSFEIEIKFSGTFQKGYPARGPSFASGGEPGEPDSFEDLEIEDISALRWAPGEGDGYKRLSLLAGIDRKSAMARAILEVLENNILDFVGQEELDNVLFGEMGDE